MTGYDIDSLMSIKDSFQGNDFQWVKTKDRTKLGKIVRVTDVFPGNRGSFIAQLSDGTKIPTDQLTSSLMMVMADQQPMSMTEILSINEIPSLDGQIQVSPEIPPDFAQEILSSAKSLPTKPVNQTTSAQPQSRETDPGDLFGMFSLEETDLTLSVSIKLPARNLLKMMYTNSQNKEEFLNKLAIYINNNVTIDAIKSSMRKTLDPDKKKKV
jgi:hypothetical protein